MSPSEAVEEVKTCRHGVPNGRDCGSCDLSPDTEPSAQWGPFWIMTDSRKRLIGDEFGNPMVLTRLPDDWAKQQARGMGFHHVFLVRRS